jgi:Ser/Thr protein kinase RdoA (MazF antagonist)
MFSLDELDRIEQSFSNTLGVPQAEFVRMRIGQNALFKIPSLKAVLRVYRGSAMLTHAKTELAFSRYLALNNVPSVQPSEAFGNAIIQSEQFVATLWGWIEPSSEKASPAALGEIIRRIHDVGSKHPNLDLELPTFDPLSSVNQRLENIKSSAVLPDSIIRSLEVRIEYVRDIWDAFRSCQPLQVIHGDAHTGNLIVSNDTTHICDFDSVSIGPVEIDAVPISVISRRFKPDEKGLLGEFDLAYGASEEFRRKANSLMPVRELTMVSWLAQDAQPGTERFMELKKRIESITETEEPFTKWHPK